MFIMLLLIKIIIIMIMEIMKIKIKNYQIIIKEKKIQQVIKILLTILK